jgi:hypothetical protein
MKLAGEFEFLGDAYPGDPEYDAPPKKGVVKLFYPPSDATGDREDGAPSIRCGFFRCPWWRWGAFKEAATRLQPDRTARGIYPVATIVTVSNRSTADPVPNQKANGR